MNINHHTPRIHPAAIVGQAHVDRRRLALAGGVIALLLAGCGVNPPQAGAPASQAAASTPAVQSSGPISTPTPSPTPTLDREPSILTSISTAPFPYGGVLSADASRLYLVHLPLGNEVGGQVSVIDTLTNSVTTTIAAGDQPFWAALSPDDTKLYVLSRGREWGSGTLLVIDLAAVAIVAQIPVGSLDGKDGHVLSADGTRLYVRNPSLEADGEVGVVDTTTGKVVASIPVSGYPRLADLSGEGTRLYVTTSEGVAVIDTATNTVASTIPVDGPSWAGQSPDGTRLYVTNISTDKKKAGQVTVIDTATNKAIDTIRFRASATRTLTGTLNKDGTRLYVLHIKPGTTATCEVSVVDTSARTVIADIAAGVDCYRAELSPDDSRLYVLGIDSDDVTVIDTETNTVAATIPVQSPLWGGLSPDGTRLYATSRETDSEDDWQVAVIDTGRAPVNVR